MEWSEKFNLGIDVIDNQHRQILDYINALEKIRATGAREQIKDVFDDLIDYTQSHLALKKTCWHRSIINSYHRIVVFTNSL